MEFEQFVMSRISSPSPILPVITLEAGGIEPVVVEIAGPGPE